MLLRQVQDVLKGDMAMALHGQPLDWVGLHVGVQHDVIMLRGRHADGALEYMHESTGSATRATMASQRSSVSIRRAVGKVH